LWSPIESARIQPVRLNPARFVSRREGRAQQAVACSTFESLPFSGGRRLVSNPFFLIFTDLFARAEVKVDCHPLESWVGGDWGFHRCTYSISAKLPVEDEAREDSGQHIYILRHEGDRWKILRGIWVSERPATVQAVFVRKR